MERIQFPEEPVLSRERYRGRNWPQTTRLVEPAYVCHGPLYFEELNSERYGWDLGLAQPILSTGIFYFDLLTLPYQVASSLGDCYDCSSGKCLPGDPVPYLLYPPQLSLTGSLAEAATLIALLAVFP